MLGTEPTDRGFHSQGLNLDEFDCKEGSSIHPNFLCTYLLGMFVDDELVSFATVVDGLREVF